MSDFDYERRPGCPAWCQGHGECGRSSTHTSEPRRTARIPGSPFDGEVSVSVVLLGVRPEDSVQVMVNRLHPDVDQQAAVFLNPKDAASWAVILDAAGSTELAALIRDATALAGSGEVRS